MRPDEPPPSPESGSSSPAPVTKPAFVIATIGGPTWVRPLLTGGAAIFLVSLVLNVVKPPLPRAYLPSWLLFFVQSTCLFPNASRAAIDYRLEAWDCASQSFREIDPSPYFPVHADDKESLFQRIGHFYRQDRPVLRALEEFIVSRENSAHPSARIGGIRLSSLRLPLPKPGDVCRAWTREPLLQHPDDQIKHWFYTPLSRRKAYCSNRSPVSERAEPPAKEPESPPEGSKGDHDFE